MLCLVFDYWVARILLFVKNEFGVVDIWICCKLCNNVGHDRAVFGLHAGF